MKNIAVSGVILAAALMVSCGGCGKGAAPQAMAPEAKPVSTPAEKPKETAARAEKKEAAHKPIRTEDDIKEVYGRLEVVTLTDGKRYRGAVISVGDEYTMVTANGIVKIPMNEVGARDIIR